MRDEAGAVLIAGVTRLEQSDYVQVYRHAPANRRAMMVIFPMALVSPLAAAATFWSGSSTSVGVILVVIAFFFGFLAWRLRNAGAVAYRALDEWRRQVRFELTEHRMRVRTESSSEELEWDRYYTWNEWGDCFCLEHPVNMYRIIPKRAFSPEEQEPVREILRSRVKGRPRAGSGAFLWRAILLWALLILMFIAIYQLVAGPR